MLASVVHSQFQPTLVPNQVACPAPRQLPEEVPFDLARLWRDLSLGRCTLTQTGRDATHDWAIVRTSPADEPRRSVHRIEILERVVLGESPKAVAFDLGLALSSVSSACNEGLSLMGSERSVSRAPLVLVMAAHAVQGLRFRAVAQPSCNGNAEDGKQLLIRVARSDDWLKRSIAPAEFEVVCLLFAGHSRRAVAAARQTTLRTIANQLASVYRKLRITCRSDLARKIVQAQAVEMRLQRQPQALRCAKVAGERISRLTQSIDQNLPGQTQ